MDKKTGIVLAVIALAAIAFIALGTKDKTADIPMETGMDSSHEMPEATGPNDMGMETGEDLGASVSVGTSTTKSFTVDGDNFKFLPNAMTVKKGDTVKITFKNTGGVHDLKIDEFGVATAKLAGGQEETVTFVADKAGTFEYYCSIGNHRQMGMKGTLTVI